ncbi:MAG: AAA domain-containing protein [Gemmatimonadota bacterium]|nr:AAA domain-containing protein [Gemmatimonadota bacterium]
MDRPGNDPQRSSPSGSAGGHEVLWLLLGDCQRAIEEEIEAVRDDLRRRGLDAAIPAGSGSARGEAGSGFRYAFQIQPGRHDIRVDDRVRIRTSGRETLGIVLGYERRLGLVQVLSLDWLGDRLSGPELEFDPTWLLRELAARLDEIAEDPAAFHPGTVLALFGRTPPRLSLGAVRLETSMDLNPPQTAALERVLGSETQLVWGPPGTGKSRLVARAALELGAEGRVLVTATTNGAVDEIATRLIRLASPEQLAANRIVRVGSEIGASAADPSPLTELTLEAALARRVKAGAGRISAALGDLEGAYRIPVDANGNAPPPHARAARLLSLARTRGDTEVSRSVGRVLLELSRQSAAVLESADIVLTTFARLSVREELRELRFESLIIDEASTAPLPYVALAAAYTSKRAVAVGDFQQLPPVVSSDGPAAVRWLKRDLFRETEVVRETAGSFELPSPRDQLCSMLDVQYRMDPAIRALVSEFFYDGRLLDAGEVEARPGARSPLVLIDTSAMGPSVERVDGSRRNRVHAEAIVSYLARAASAGQSDVAVVTPYRAQTRILHELVRGRLGRAAPRGLRVSTVHRFQGREKNVVVIDTVDAPPGRSWFLDERRNPDFPRLLNVALSRAQSMLVIVAAVEGLRKTLPEDALLNRILARMATEGHVLDARTLGHPSQSSLESDGMTFG